MAENFPDVEREMGIHIQDAKGCQIEETKKSILIHYNHIFKDKERILKAAREKQFITYKGTP